MLVLNVAVQIVIHGNVSKVTVRNLKEMEDIKILSNEIGKRLKQGLEPALGELIDLYQRKIFNIGYRYTGNYEEARDLAQEIFLRAYRKIHLYRDDTDFESWFYKLAVNHALNYRKKIMRNPSQITSGTTKEDNDHINETPDLDEKIISNEMQDRIRLFVNELPRREKMAIIFQLWEDRSINEIAELMDTSPKAVEALLTRARKRLKKIAEKCEGCF